MRFRMIVLGVLAAVVLRLDAASPDDQVVPPAAQSAFDNGMASARRGEWAGAIRGFSGADEAAPRTPVILFNLGFACAKAGREEEAILWWEACRVATRDPMKAAEVGRQIDVLENAVLAKTGRIFAHALIEARRLPDPADKAYALLETACLFANAGNIEAGLRIAGDRSSPKPGADNGVVECWKNYYTSLCWSRNAGAMIRSLDRLPAAINRDELLAGYVSFLCDEGQFDSARRLAGKITDPDLRTQLDSRSQSGQETDDRSNADIPPDDVKSAAADEWIKRARQASRRPALADQAAAIIKNEYLVTGAVTVMRTTRDIPVQVANLAEGRAGEILGAVGLERKQAERASRFYSLANWKYLDGDYPAAVACLDRALAVNPYGSDEIFALRAEIRQKMKDVAGAMADYDQVIRLNPRPFSAYFNRAILKGKCGDLDGAIADEGRAIEIDPTRTVAYYNRSLHKYHQRDWEGALADIEKAIAIEPGDPAAFVLRGGIREICGDNDGAIADYDRTLELDAGNLRAYYCRSMLKARRGQFDSAIADCDQALALNPRGAAFLSRRGSIKLIKEDRAGAIADFDRAIAVNPNFEEAYSERALAKSMNGDPDGAIGDYRRLAGARWRRGDLDGALEHLENASEIDPDDAGVRVFKGDVERTIGEFEAAIEDYDVAIRNGGDEPFAEYAHLERHLLSRRLNRADDDLAREVAKWDEGWERRIGLFLTGKLKEKDLLAKAAGDDTAGTRVEECQAYYYIGMMHLLARDLKTARVMFEKCLGTGVSDCDHYEFADSELARMDAADRSRTR